MALARDDGQRVVCVTATRGERGTPDPVAWPPDRLAAERTHELARCLDVLGVCEHHWLGYRDGECAGADRDAAVARLCAVLDDVRPDTVLTFGPDGITGHPDHRTVSAWAGAAVDRAAPSGARLLHSAVTEQRAARWGALPTGWASICRATRCSQPPSGWPSTSSCRGTSRCARSGRWPRRRRRPPG